LTQLSPAPIAAVKEHAARWLSDSDGGESAAMEFFSHEIHQPDDELLRSLASIGRQIGQFIERKAAKQRSNDRDLLHA
jgi:hypothetical protein